MQYADLLENSNDLIQVVGFDGRIIYVNRMWQETLGYGNDDLAQVNFFDLLHADFHCDCQDRIQRLMSGETVPRFEVEYKTRYGHKIIAEGSISLYKENGEPCGIQGFFRDITARKETEKALQTSEERFRTIYESSVAGIAMLAPDGHFLQANSAFCNFLGYSEEELLQLKITDVTHPEDIKDTLSRRNIACANRLHSIVCEKRYIRKDGSVFWAQLSSTWFFDDNGNPLYTVPVIQDITRRKEAEQRIRELAYYDSLTGLANRTLFNDRLDQVMARSRRRQSRFALMFLDLDRFKGVNDTLGHAVGDAMLRQAAERLTSCLRENDTVARLGGDEFVIILSDYKGDANLPRVADKILKSLSSPFDLGVREVYSSTSIGIAIYPEDGDEATDLLRHADMAMYAAKESGGDTFRFYSSEMNARAVSRMDMEANLRRALEQEEFFIEYQPQIDLITNKVAGVEALLRWQHPQLGVIPPTQFIGLAEETNLILPLGEWVMQRVFEQCVMWKREGYLPFRVGINVSGRQFAQPDFVDMVCRLLDETGAAPELLEFEITESVVMKDVDAAVLTLEALKKLGINMAIDDFGTGYSSLSCLKHLPLNRLKIDKSFISDLQDNADDRAIVEATIAMAKRLDLGVTAEGVETEGQYGFVQKRECDEVQGFYFSRPLSPSEVADTWLIKR
ncbi:EAL domain-containing protein [uncultured Desulfuromonas sp.]|uniref:putative bifunctional diguanylate cyclase/phosphodiesterase n=1 Tax=uncultured Desulfuromonas sp. TaxID=181013 RepID=UPI002AABD2CE|nr:EAL domain-containing protein [uncultured Desulfuromonas sp.]